MCSSDLNGLQAWGKETGESYDLSIGANRLRTCMQKLVSRSPASRTGLIINLGDWQHTDDDTNRTPEGKNSLDADGRYYKILTTGILLMKDAIDLALQKHEKVIVKNLRGNHDKHSSLALTVALSAFYTNNPRVTIDTSPNDFYYFRFGNTLLGATHGHTLKPDKMAMVLATDRKKDWYEAKYHWFLYGHYHKPMTDVYGDVKVECFPNIAGNDAWSHTRGYRAPKYLTSVVLHTEDGEDGRHQVNI